MTKEIIMDRVVIASRLVRLAGSILGPGVPDGTGLMSGTGACPLEDEEFVEGEPEVVGDVDVASALTDLARKLVGKKGEVPEAFKKQWKNKDKDGDGKENEPKPDFVKEIEKKKKGKKAGTILGPGIPDGTGPMRGTGMCPMDDDEEEIIEGEPEIIEDLSVASELVKLAKKVVADWNEDEDADALRDKAIREFAKHTGGERILTAMKVRGKWTVFTTELGAYRIARAYRTAWKDVGVSKNIHRGSWYVNL